MEDEIKKPWPLDQVKKKFGVCDKTIRNWVKKGLLVRVPEFGHVLITDESVRRLANGGR
jgi:predicted site-specific integrase-resolvase